MMNLREFWRTAIDIPWSRRPKEWWDILAVLGGIAVGLVWFVYTSLRGPYQGLDIVSPMLMIVIPIALIEFRGGFDRMILPVQKFRAGIAKPILIIIGIIVPFLTAFILYNVFGLRNDLLLQLNIIIGTLGAYVIMRDPELFQDNRQGRGFPPGTHLLLITLATMVFCTSRAIASGFAGLPMNDWDCMVCAFESQFISGLIPAILVGLLSGHAITRMLMQRKQGGGGQIPGGQPYQPPPPGKASRSYLSKQTDSDNISENRIGSYQNQYSSMTYPDTRADMAGLTSQSSPASHSSGNHVSPDGSTAAHASSGFPSSGGQMSPDLSTASQASPSSPTSGGQISPDGSGSAHVSSASPVPGQVSTGGSASTQASSISSPSGGQVTPGGSASAQPSSYTSGGQAAVPGSAQSPFTPGPADIQASVAGSSTPQSSIPTTPDAQASLAGASLTDSSGIELPSPPDVYDVADKLRELGGAIKETRAENLVKSSVPGQSSGSGQVCPKCNASLGSWMKFCNKCGTPVSQSPAGGGCPQCGATIEPGARFCRKCGKKLQ